MRYFILAILLPLALFAQPQSPNFLMASETFSAIASRDSSQNYLLISSVCQLSVADTHSSPTYILTSGFLAPAFTELAPNISVNPDTLLYGEVWINTVSQDSFVITNTGNAELRVDSIVCDNPIFPSLPVPFTVLPEQSHTVLYDVILPDTLSYTAHLTVHSNAGNPTVFVSAHGIWTELVANPAFVDLGTVAFGDTADATLSLASIGNTSLTIDTVRLAENFFSIAASPSDTIPPYDSTGITVRFIAQSSGVFLDTLIIENSAGSPVRVPLSAGVTSTEGEADLIPRVFFLDQNFPNPFNPSTTIRFGVPRSADVSIGVYDVLGRNVTTLVSGRLEAGYHTARWTCSECPSGVYIARMTSPDVVMIRKLLLLK